MEQYNLNFQNINSYTQDNFIVSECNKNSFDYLIANENNINFIYLFGPSKS